MSKTVQAFVDRVTTVIGVTSWKPNSCLAKLITNRFLHGRTSCRDQSGKTQKGTESEWSFTIWRL